MNECFITIRDLSEVPEGLRVQHRDGATSLLRRDNERYARIEAILRNAHGMSVPWPVRIARSADGVILNAWVAWGGRVFVVDEEPSGDCTAYFLLVNSPKTLKRDHPEFMRLLETLMLSAGEKRDVFYFEAPGEKNVLADVCLAS
jgi:hypothetical protein